MKGVRFACVALNIFIIQNTSSTIDNDLITLRTLIIYLPIALLAYASIVYWFWLKIIVAITKQADLWIEAYFASNSQAVHR